jgi:hypothetical protein
MTCQLGQVRGGVGWGDTASQLIMITNVLARGGSG